MICVAVASALVGDTTIHKALLVDRTHAPAHRIRMSFPLLSTLSVRDAMRKEPVKEGDEPVADQITVEAGTSLVDALYRLAEEEATHAVAVDHGQRVGQLTNRDPCPPTN